MSRIYGGIYGYGVYGEDMYGIGYSDIDSGDTITITDIITRYISLTRTLNEETTINDTIEAYRQVIRNLTDNLTITDSFRTIWNKFEPTRIFINGNTKTNAIPQFIAINTNIPVIKSLNTNIPVIRRSTPFFITYT
jgi:hypothetical protein